MDARRGTRSLGRGLTRTTLVWVAVVVVALVVIDIALVTLALGRTAPEENGPAGPIPTYSSSPRPGSGSTGSAPPAGPPDSADGAASHRLLSAVDAKEAWRASSGTCGGSAPVLEHTTDGGDGWSPVALGGDVRSLLSIRGSDDTLAILAGVGSDCTPTVRTSNDGGGSWSAGAAGAAGAAVDADSVVLSTGTIASPCSGPRGAYQGQRTAVVICDGSVQWRTGNSAWVPVAMTGVRAVLDAGDRYTIARVGATGCDGVQIASMPAVSVTPTTTADPVGCAADAPAGDDVAVDRAGPAVWVWSGDDVMVSNDSGASW